MQPRKKNVLQGLHCIAIESAVGWIELYCNRFKCIAREGWVGKFCIAIHWFVLQARRSCIVEKRAVCIAIQMNCIVTEAVRLWGRFVLQYKLYCEVQEQEAGLPVSQGR